MQHKECVSVHEVLTVYVSGSNFYYLKEYEYRLDYAEELGNVRSPQFYYIKDRGGEYISSGKRIHQAVLMFGCYIVSLTIGGVIATMKELLMSFLKAVL